MAGRGPPAACQPRVVRVAFRRAIAAIFKPEDRFGLAPARPALRLAKPGLLIPTACAAVHRWPPRALAQPLVVGADGLLRPPEPVLARHDRRRRIPLHSRTPLEAPLDEQDGEDYSQDAEFVNDLLRRDLRSQPHFDLSDTVGSA